MGKKSCGISIAKIRQIEQCAMVPQYSVCQQLSLYILIKMFKNKIDFHLFHLHRPFGVLLQVIASHKPEGSLCRLVISVFKLFRKFKVAFI